MALWGVAGAATQALMTQLVAPDQQGQLQGATTSVQSMSQLVGPFLFTLTFAYFIGDQRAVEIAGRAVPAGVGAAGAGAVAIAGRTLAMQQRRSRQASCVSAGGVTHAMLAMRDLQWSENCGLRARCTIRTDR